jgi:hypothetical protein
MCDGSVAQEAFVHFSITFALRSAAFERFTSKLANAGIKKFSFPSCAPRTCPEKNLPRGLTFSWDRDRAGGTPREALRVLRASWRASRERAAKAKGAEAANDDGAH